VGSGDAEIGGPRFNVDRHISRFHHQKLDRRIARRDEELASSVVADHHTGRAESGDRRLEEAAFGEGYPNPGHAATSAIVPRSSDTPTASLGRPNRPIRSS